VSDPGGALEAIERVVNRGGEADDVLRDVVRVLHERGFSYAAVSFVEGDRLVPGPSAGREADGIEAPVVFGGSQVATFELATDDGELVRRIATLISPYALVGWDTGGEAWTP